MITKQINDTISFMAQINKDGLKNNSVAETIEYFKQNIADDPNILEHLKQIIDNKKDK